MKSLFDRLRARRLTSAFTLLATLSVAVVAGSFAAHGVRGQDSPGGIQVAPLKVINSKIAPNPFVKIAQEVRPAVVNIKTETLPRESASRGIHGHLLQPQNPGDKGGNGKGGDGKNGGGGSDQGPDSFQNFFNRFFGGQVPGGPDDGDNGSDVQESLGSGFIVDPSGYIITNDHVIDHADRIYVKLSTDPDTQDPGRPAHVIGVDKATDLAVIKIDGEKPLPVVKMGNSDEAQVGDWVEAIGSPFALSQTVTAGIISAKNRTLDQGAPGQFQHFIQTDAAINPGNSGGPLLDMNGNVIGVNTAIYTQSAGYQGIGFAMPSNVVVSVYNDLVGPSHKVTRGSIGVSFREDLSDAVNRVYGFKSGVLVQEVQPGGPADKAGLKNGDVIQSIDGHGVKNGDELVNEIASRRPGSTAVLGYLRDGKALQATVSIGDRDKVFASLLGDQNQAAPQSSAGAGEAKLGLVVRSLTPAIAARIHTQGVIIESVRTGSFADLQGLEPDYVITKVNRQPVADRDQFDAVVSKLKAGDDVVFEVLDPNHPELGINYVGGTLQ
ncbi:MAG TPA: trypsin-like peptidase domain-containing protein [Terracidiphilus sp.]|nr:trypsin-like peptidase domain-containing protein [Terracidiphilus sp.]